MKYLLFGAALLVGVPLMSGAALAERRFRDWLVALLVFAPILGDLASINFLSTEHYRGPDRGFELTLADLVALALAGALLGRAPKGLRWLPYNSLWLLALFGLGLASTCQASVSLFGAFTLFKGLRLYLYYWVVVNLLRTGTPFEPVRRGLVAAGLFMTALALQQKYVLGLYRVHGPFDHSNGIPLYANLVIAPLVVWAVGQGGLPRPEALLTLGSALGLLFAVVATQSRAGLILGGFVLLGALAVAGRKVPSRRVAKTAVAVLAMVAAGGALAADTILRRFQEAPEASEQARHEFNLAARDMAHDRWLGVGLNNFSRALTDGDRYREHIEVMKDEEQGGVAHHVYWLTAAEMGFPALGVFLVVIGRFVWLAFRHGLSSRSLEGALLSAFGLGFLALHAQGTLEWGLRITPITFQFVLCCALVVGLRDRLPGRGEAPHPGADGPRPGPRAELQVPVVRRRSAAGPGTAREGASFMRSVHQQAATAGREPRG